MKFIGRENEKKELNKCLVSDRSHFVAIYGSGIQIQ
jgi:AAA+ ATPase superfamily predicted ATPase